MKNKLLQPLVSVPTMNTRGLADAEHGPATLLDPRSQAKGAGSPEASQAKGEEADGESAAASGASPASERLSPDNAASPQSIRKGGREVSFIFMSGDLACQGIVCSDATVGTFNSLLRDAGFSIPEGMVYSQGERKLPASQTQAVVYDENSPGVKDDEPWTLVLSGQHRSRIATLDDIS